MSKIYVEQLTIKDLSEMIKMSVYEALEAIVQTQNKKKMLSRTEVCDYLGISKTSFHNYVKNGQLCPEYIGNKPFIPISQLENLSKSSSKSSPLIQLSAK